MMLEIDPTTAVAAGDWHGNTRWAVAAIAQAATYGARTILHLGDYGYLYSHTFCDAVEQALAAHEMQLLFVRGNHDDVDHLDQLPRDPHGHGIVSARVRHLRDGQRVMLGDEVVLALGGAGSIDRAHRLPGASWWADEITPAAVIEQAIADGPADIVLAHDCPTGVDLRLDPSFGAFYEDDDPGVLEYCEENRERLRVAAEALRPRLWLHGHYHQVTREQLVHDDGERTLVVGLDCDGESLERNLVRVEGIG